MSDYRPQRPPANNSGLPRIDWRGTLWATLCVFVLSSVLIFLFPAMHGLLRIILVLGLYFGGRHTYRKYVRGRR
jgi:hypothetical protein